jgi:hypothetical protein
VTGLARWLCSGGVIWCVGCGGAPALSPEVKQDLGNLYIAYHFFYGDMGRAPRDAEELLAYESPAAESLTRNAESQTRARNALSSGEYVVIWNAVLKPEAEQNAGFVLMYHKDTPIRGGAVCYQDGKVKVLMPDEFEKAPKAQVATGAGLKPVPAPSGRAEKSGEPGAG